MVKERKSHVQNQQIASTEAWISDLDTSSEDSSHEEKVFHAATHVEAGETMRLRRYLCVEGMGHECDGFAESFDHLMGNISTGYSGSDSAICPLANTAAVLWNQEHFTTSNHVRDLLPFQCSTTQDECPSVQSFPAKLVRTLCWHNEFHSNLDLALSCPYESCSSYRLEAFQGNWRPNPHFRCHAFLHHQAFEEHMRTIHHESPFYCPVPGCERRGSRGYFRLGDFVQHQRDAHCDLLSTIAFSFRDWLDSIPVYFGYLFEWNLLEDSESVFMTGSHCPRTDQATIKHLSVKTDNLEHAIRNEISWYFSPDYLLGDINFRRRMNSKGFVLFAVFANLPRLRKLVTDQNYLLEVCRSSLDVEVQSGLDGVHFIRSTNDWRQWLLPPVNRETLAQNDDNLVEDAPSFAIRLGLCLHPCDWCSILETPRIDTADSTFCQLYHDLESNSICGDATRCYCQSSVMATLMNERSTSEFSSTYDSTTSPKDKLVEKLMWVFRTSFYAHLLYTGAKSATFSNIPLGNEANSDSKEPPVLSHVDESIEVSSGAKRTRKCRSSDNFSEDERRNGSRDGGSSDISLGNDMDATTNRKFACPYYKRCPTRYMNQRSCPGPGWTTVARVKEHIYRCHRLPMQCDRCGATLATRDLLKQHKRETPVCPVRFFMIREGLTPSQEESLRSRKRGATNMTEHENWNRMYKLLFPDDDHTQIPTPYYEISDPKSKTLDTYVEFLQLELPPQMRQRLILEVEHELTLEEDLRRRLPDIIRVVHQGLYRLYTSQRTPITEPEDALSMGNNVAHRSMPEPVLVDNHITDDQADDWLLDFWPLSPSIFTDPSSSEIPSEASLMNGNQDESGFI